MNFSQALEVIKKGGKVYRLNDPRNRVLYLVPGSQFAVNRAPLLGIFPAGHQINYQPHIDCIQDDDDVAVWSPTQEDLLAEDWEVNEYK